MEIDSKYEIIIDGDNNDDSEELKKEYQTVISQLRLHQLDYAFIRKFLTIVKPLVVEYDYDTPEELKQIYDVTLIDDTLSAIRKFYNKNVNTLIFSYSISQYAKKAFLSSIKFEEIKKKDQEKHINEFNKFFKYAIKYVIVIQNNNNVIIRKTSDVTKVLKELKYVFSNVILYFKRTESNAEEVKTKDIKNKIAKRSCSQPRQNTSIQDFYDNAILDFSMSSNVDKTKNTVKPNKQIEPTITQNKPDNNIGLIPTNEVKPKIMNDTKITYLRSTKAYQNERNNIGIKQKDNSNYLNRNIDILKNEQEIKKNLNELKNNEAINYGWLIQNSNEGPNKINLDINNQYNNLGKPTNDRKIRTNVQETLKIDKVSNSGIRRPYSQLAKPKNQVNNRIGKNYYIEQNDRINFDNFSNFEYNQNEEKMKILNKYIVDDNLDRGLYNANELTTFDKTVDKKDSYTRHRYYSQEKRDVNNQLKYDNYTFKQTKVYKSKINNLVNHDINLLGNLNPQRSIVANSNKKDNIVQYNNQYIALGSKDLYNYNPNHMAQYPMSNMDNIYTKLQINNNNKQKLSQASISGNRGNKNIPSKLNFNYPSSYNNKNFTRNNIY